MSLAFQLRNFFRSFFSRSSDIFSNAFIFNLLGLVANLTAKFGFFLRQFFYYAFNTHFMPTGKFNRERKII
jgi:hypothetical protein